MVNTNTSLRKARIRESPPEAAPWPAMHQCTSPLSPYSKFPQVLVFSSPPLSGRLLPACWLSFLPCNCFCLCWMPSLPLSSSSSSLLSSWLYTHVVVFVLPISLLFLSLQKENALQLFVTPGSVSLLLLRHVWVSLFRTPKLQMQRKKAGRLLTLPIWAQNPLLVLLDLVEGKPQQWGVRFRF